MTANKKKSVEEQERPRRERINGTAREWAARLQVIS